MPDKAIDLIDEAAAQARIARGGTNKPQRELEQKLQAMSTKIDDAVYHQDFEHAAKLKAEASRLEKQMSYRR